MTIDLRRPAAPVRGHDAYQPDEEPGRIRRVLVVDDEDGIRLSLAEFLEVHGFEVETAPDVLVARDLLATCPFDLVLTDIAMPGLTGLDLLAEVKARDPGIEVILITGHFDLTYAIEAMRHGAYDYFTKPINYEKIVLTIARVEEKRRYQEQAWRYEALRRQREFEEQAVLETTLGLARAVEERDRYNIGHGKRTANYAVMIGRRLGFAEDHLQRLRQAGILHDVGKIGIDDKILNKPGPLSPDEFVAIRRHPEIGEYILKPISFLHDIARVVRHHHERWDGRGYPDGLAGEEIPLDARILCIADYFDSVTSERPYRSPMPVPAALDLLRSESRKTFDPVILDIFIEELLSRAACGAD